MSGLTLGDVLDAQAKYRAILPEMVERETVIRLILQAVDDTMEAFRAATGAVLPEMIAAAKARKDRITKTTD